MWEDTISIQKKSLALQYTNDKRAEKETRETPPLTIATNKIKYLGVMLTKEAKDLYEKNFKCLKKEIEDDTRKWKDHMFLESQDKHIKNEHLTTAIYRFSQNHITILHRP